MTTSTDEYCIVFCCIALQLQLYTMVSTNSPNALYCAKLQCIELNCIVLLCISTDSFNADRFSSGSSEQNNAKGKGFQLTAVKRTQCKGERVAVNSSEQNTMQRGRVDWFSCEKHQQEETRGEANRRTAV